MADEGELFIYDISDPANPVEIHSEYISGTHFSVKVKKDLVENKPLKISFESAVEESKSRELLVESQAKVEAINATLNQDSTIKARINEQQLKIEIEKEAVLPEDSKNKLASISKVSYESELGIIGDKEAVIKLLFHSAAVARETSYWLAIFRIESGKVPEKQNLEIINKAISTVKALAVKFNFLNPYLEKLADIGKIDFKGVASLADGKKLMDSVVIKTESNVFEVMKKDGVDEKSDIWIQVVNRIADLKKAKLEELNKLFPVNVKYADKISEISKIDLGQVKSYEEGEKLITGKADELKKGIVELLKKDGLDEKHSDYLATMQAFEEALAAKLLELKNLSWAKG